jgi:hypothetical protein
VLPSNTVSVATIASATAAAYFNHDIAGKDDEGNLIILHGFPREGAARRQERHAEALQSAGGSVDTDAAKSDLDGGADHFAE